MNWINGTRRGGTVYEVQVFLWFILHTTFLKKGKNYEFILNQR